MWSTFGHTCAHAASTTGTPTAMENPSRIKKTRHPYLSLTPTCRIRHPVRGHKNQPHNVPEHSNLVHDVIPVPGRLQLLRQQAVQLLPHVDDTSRHRPDITLPLLKQFGVVEYERNLHSHTMHLSVKRFRVGARADGRSQPEGSETHQTRPMGRRVADLRPGEHRQLTLDPGGALLRRRHDMQRSDPLAVQSGVLREALS